MLRKHLDQNIESFDVDTEIQEFRMLPEKPSLPFSLIQETNTLAATLGHT